MTADTVEAIVKIGGLILTALALVGGGVKFLLLNRSGSSADLVAELRKQLEQQDKRIEDLERELEERDNRHRDEIDRLQREVRDLYERQRPRPT